MFTAMRDIPCIRDYEQALKRWEGTTPIRGRAVDTRPLSRRNKTHMLIEKTTYDALDAVACRLYNTNVVTFVCDGRVIIDNTWPSSSTNQFASRILPNAWMQQRGGRVWLKTLSGAWLVGDELELKKDEHGRLTPTTPHEHYIHKLDRKKWAEVSAVFKPFMKHAVNMAKLLSGEYESKFVLRPAFAFTYMANQDREGWSEVMQWLFYESRVTRYSWESRSWLTSLSLPRLQKNMTDMIKREYSEVLFRKELVPAGVYKKDSNVRYVR